MDVVIPALNPTATQLQRAIASARKTNTVSRIILVDDGSSIPLEETLAQARIRPPDLVLTLPKNQGPSAARNAGAAKATTEFILFLDVDDELIPQGVEALLNQTQSLNAIAGVAQRQFDTNAHRSAKPLPAGWADNVLPSPAEVFRPIELFSASALLVREGVFSQGTRFDSTLLLGEDRDFLRKVSMLGPIAVSAEPAVVMHRDGNNLTSSTHLTRRVADHITLLDRWCDAESNANFQTATNWLINACSKSDVTDQTWQNLIDAASQQSWPLPAKARARRLLRSIIHKRKQQPTS